MFSQGLLVSQHSKTPCWQGVELQVLPVFGRKKHGNTHKKEKRVGKSQKWKQHSYDPCSLLIPNYIVVPNFLHQSLPSLELMGARLLQKKSGPSRCNFLLGPPKGPIFRGFLVLVSTILFPTCTATQLILCSNCFVFLNEQLQPWEWHKTSVF